MNTTMTNRTLYVELNTPAPGNINRDGVYNYRWVSVSIQLHDSDDTWLSIFPNARRRFIPFDDGFISAPKGFVDKNDVVLAQLSAIPISDYLLSYKYTYKSITYN